MIYTNKDFDIPDFNNVDEAYSFFGDHCNYKYDILWCTISGKSSCILGSSMAEDYALIGSIQNDIESFLAAGDVSDADGTVTALISEIRDYIYDKLEDWGVANFYYYIETF